MRFKTEELEERKEIEKVPEGDHDMYLYMVVHMGAHTSNPAYGASAKYYFAFETPNLKTKFRDDEPEKPFSQGRTIYGGKKANLFYNELRDNRLTDDEKQNGWDTNLIVGKLYDVQVTHDPAASNPAKIYANLCKIRKVYKTVPEGTPAMTNPVKLFSIANNPKTKAPFLDAADVIACAEFQALPKWIRNEIRKSVEFQRFDDCAKFPKEE